MSPLSIVVMVVGIVVVVAAINLAIWLPIMRRMNALPQALTDELVAAGDTIVRAPERARYCGNTSERVNVLGIGMLALGTRTLVFKKATGGRVDLPLDQIVGVREDKRFLRSYNGRPFLIIQLSSGAELGFFVADREAWKSALRR